MRPKVYLAGPITGLSWADATEWRNCVASCIPSIEFLSPLRSKEYLAGEDSLKDHYLVSPLSTPRGITTRDRWDAMRCDALFANLLGSKKVSIGTVMEIAWADAVRVPIVLVMEKEDPHWHSMILECAGFVAPDLGSGINILRALFGVAK